MGEVSLSGALGLNSSVQCYDEGRTASPGTIRVGAKYFPERDSDLYKQIASLDDYPNSIDNSIELLLAMQYTAAVKVRPVKAQELLPEGHASDVKLAAATYAKLQEIKFLDPQNSECIGRYELMIQTLKKRNGVEQTEINASMRSLISDAVDEEFNRISFVIRDTAVNRTYSAVLTHNLQTGEYILSYERPGVQNSRKELSALSLAALSSKMRNDNEYKGDFSKTSIDTMEAQAALIPAAALSVVAINDIKGFLTNFFVNPGTATYNALVDIGYVLHERSVASASYFLRTVSESYAKALISLNEPLARKIFKDEEQRNTVLVLTREQIDRIAPLTIK